MNQTKKIALPGLPAFALSNARVPRLLRLRQAGFSDVHRRFDEHKE